MAGCDSKIKCYCCAAWTLGVVCILTELIVLGCFLPYFLEYEDNGDGSHAETSLTLFFIGLAGQIVGAMGSCCVFGVVMCNCINGQCCDDPETNGEEKEKRKKIIIAVFIIVLIIVSGVFQLAAGIEMALSAADQPRTESQAFGGFISALQFIAMFLSIFFAITTWTPNIRICCYQGTD